MWADNALHNHSVLSDQSQGENGPSYRSLIQSTSPCLTISTRRREKISSINKAKQKKKLDLSNLYFQRWDFLDEQSQKPSESYSHSWQTGLHKLLYYGIHRKIPTAENITFKFFCCRPSPKMVWCILNNWLTQLKSLWQCQWSPYK